jgi:conjugative relaxase-like TrwC/TraI family protein
VTVSIARVSAGRGYEYLLRSIAVDDGRRDGATPLTRYYTAAGNPPGRWLGSGLSGLGGGAGLQAGSEVTERQMFRLFGQGMDPVSGECLGLRPYRTEPCAGRGSVAGFDLTFSVPKSVSVLWGLADAGLQQQIAAAHHAALATALRFVEEQVAATRIGRDGVAQAEVRGVLAAAFDHWDSRANDPNLHTHVVIANRVQGLDGVWRTLDSRALYRAVVAISETYNGLLADELTRRVGVRWEARERRRSAARAWEIAGVPGELMRLFSRRSLDIEVEKDRLIESFRRDHGRAPTAVEILRLRQQATLATRPDKHLHSLAELTAEWRTRAAEWVAGGPEAWARRLCDREPSRTGDEVDHAALAVQVRDAVQGKRATWSRWNLHAEAARQLMGVRFATAAERLVATGRVADLAAGESVLLTPPELAPTPVALRRRDGSSMFRFRHAERYTSRVLLDAEARLLDAARSSDGPRVDPALLDAVLAAPPPCYRYPLGPDQRRAVAAIAGSGCVLDLLVGPAGTGKTVTLAGLRTAWELEHGPGSVIGLAPSATAAHVLARALGVPTENTAKWLTEHAAQPARVDELTRCRTTIAQAAVVNPPLAAALRTRARDLQTRIDQWQLRPGQLVIIDEASLAGTLALDTITAAARTAGAKVVLVGDWAQLSAIEAGGAFRLLVAERRDTPELGAVRRYTARWERDASLQLRAGSHAAIDVYARHGRIHAGDLPAMTEAAYQAWLTDERHGRRSLLIAGDTDTVHTLNARARADLVTTGRVHPDGATLRDGTVAGIGDRIVTRRNDRRLAHPHGHVKNGDNWTVTGISRGGRLTVRAGDGTVVTLPGDYVAHDVELGYATTAYRAQGATVDTAHVVVTAAAMTRETLYVAMTRGRAGNTAYVGTDTTGPCPVHDHTGDAQRVLARVLDRAGADTAAHAQLRAEQDAAASIAQLAAEFDTIAAAAQAPRWRELLARSGLGRGQVEQITASPAFGALATALRAADASGLGVDEAMPTLVAQRPLGDAKDLAAVLHERVTRWAASRPDTYGVLVAGLIPVACGIQDPVTRAALDERARLIEQRADTLVLTALESGAEWITALGPAPTDSHRHAQWLAYARTVAALYDRSDAPAQATPGERAAARAATERAAALALTEPVAPTAPPSSLQREHTRQL